MSRIFTYFCIQSVIAFLNLSVGVFGQEYDIVLVFKPGDESSGVHHVVAMRDGKLLEENPIIIAPLKRVRMAVQNPEKKRTIERWEVKDVYKVRVKGGKNPVDEEREATQKQPVAVSVKGGEVVLDMVFRSDAPDPAKAEFKSRLPAGGFDTMPDDSAFRQRMELTHISGIARGWSKATAEKLPKEPAHAERRSGPTRTLLKKEGDPLYHVIVTVEE